MRNKFDKQNHQAGIVFLLLIFCHSLFLPYSLFNPIYSLQEVVIEDQLNPALDISIVNAYYFPEKQTSLAQVNILAFAAELVSLTFQNTIQALQLNSLKFANQKNPAYFAKVPTYLKKCLLRI